MASLALKHARLVMEIHTDEAVVDIVARGYDAGIRLGEAVQQDMMAVRLTPKFDVIMVASPDYLRARGEPKVLADLARHNCIGYRLQGSGRLYEWHVVDAGKETKVAPPSSVVVTDATAAVELALAGVGIAYVSEPMAKEHVRGGRLRWVLPEAASHEEGLFVYFPRRTGMAGKMRAFIEAARHA
jgi:DNA-binding transcriptional LysR family regulator